MQIFQHDEVKVFVKKLEKPTRSKVLRNIDLLEQYGSHLGMPHIRKITFQMYELRTRGTQKIRILFVFAEEKAILLHGFIKKTQKTPRQEIEIADRRRNQLLTATSHICDTISMNLKDFKPYSEMKKEFLADPEVKRLYDALEPEYALIRAVIDKRLQKKMSQAELARKIGTKQSAISRLESGTANPSVAFLRKVAHGLGKKLEIRFV